MKCEHCGGVMFHKKDYRSKSWNIRHPPTHLHELWVCVDCTKQKSVDVPEDGSIETYQRGWE